MTVATRLDGLILAGAALLHGLLFALGRWPGRRGLVGDERMYVALAERLAVDPTAPIDPLWPPLYPRLLALLAGLGDELPLAVTALQVALLVGAAFLLRDLALRLTGLPAVARAAWAFFLLDPQMAAFAHFLWPEVLHLALLLAVLWILVARADAWAWLGLAGALLGLACLSKSILQPFAPLLLLALVAACGVRRGVPRAALVGGVALAVVAPTVRDNLRLHGLAAVADSSRFNLLVALEENADGTHVHRPGDTAARYYREGGATFAARQAWLDERLAAHWRERGATRVVVDQLRQQPFRLFDARSFLLAQLPGGAAHFRGSGFTVAGGPLPALLRAWSYLVYALVLFGAGLGLARLPLDTRRAPPGAALASPAARAWLAALAAFLLYNLVLFMLLHAKSRFRVPFLPLLDLAAAYGLCAGALHGGADRGARRARAVGLAVSAVLLWWAFAAPRYVRLPVDPRQAAPAVEPGAGGEGR